MGCYVNKEKEINATWRALKASFTIKVIRHKEDIQVS